MRLLLVLAACILVAGCAASASLTPRPSSSGPSATDSPSPSPSERLYKLTCGPMEERACEEWAAGVIGNAAKQYPGKEVVSLTITGADGDYDLVFEDGSAIGADIN